MHAPPDYIHTDLAALLRASQSKIARFSASEGCDLLDAVRTAPPAARAAALRPLESVYRDLVKVQAPMVRCSRPAFRRLCRLWGTDVSYTHMILADSFARSAAAREAEFALYAGEDRLVCQLASSSGPTAAAAAALMAPFCDAVDVNCGCPQRWAMREGVGAALLTRPEAVADVVRCVRNGLEGGREMPCVVKMRVGDELRRSVDFARQCEAAGAAWVTVHGRTPNCSAHATVRVEAIRTVRESLSIPTVANGGVHDPQSALEMALATGVGGVMSATGLLANPACFYVPGDEETLHFTPKRNEVDEVQRINEAAWLEEWKSSKCAQVITGLPHCPLEVISDFIRLSCATDLATKATSMHLLKMGGNYLSPAERVFVSQMHSSFGIIVAFQDLGIYVDEGKYRYTPPTSLKTVTKEEV